MALKKNTKHPSLSRESISLKNTMTLASILSFTICLGILRLFHAQGHTLLPKGVVVTEASWRIVSSLHGIWVAFFSWLYLKKKISLRKWYFSLSFSIGYFIFDLARHCFCDTISFDSLLEPFVHHAIVLVVIISYINKYPKLSARGFLSEISTPLLYTSWLMLKSGYTHTIYFKLLALCLLVSFALCRVYNFTKILWDLRQQQATFWEMLFFSNIVLINYYWFILLLNKWFRG